MRGNFAVPTLFNGNLDAVFNPQGGNRTIFSDAIPGWSLHNGETSPIASTSNLVDVNQLSATDASALHAELDRIGVDRAQPNYALNLESGKSITHNRFVVPEWGTLRFNLHVPELTTNGKVKVSIKRNTPTDEYQTLYDRPSMAAQPRRSRLWAIALRILFIPNRKEDLQPRARNLPPFFQLGRSTKSVHKSVKISV